MEIDVNLLTELLQLCFMSLGIGLATIMPIELLCLGIMKAFSFLKL